MPKLTRPHAATVKQYLSDPSNANAYLEAAVEEGIFLEALREIAEAHGLTNAAAPAAQHEAEAKLAQMAAHLAQMTSALMDSPCRCGEGTHCSRCRALSIRDDYTAAFLDRVKRQGAAGGVAADG